MCTAIDGRADRAPLATCKDCKASARSFATVGIASSGVATIMTELPAISSRDRSGSLDNPFVPTCSLVVFRRAPACFELAAPRATTKLMVYPALLSAVPSSNPKRPAPSIDTEWPTREDGRERRSWLFLFVATTGGDDPSSASDSSMRPALKQFT